MRQVAAYSSGGLRSAWRRTALHCPFSSVIQVGDLEFGWGRR